MVAPDGAAILKAQNLIEILIGWKLTVASSLVARCYGVFFVPVVWEEDLIQITIGICHRRNAVQAKLRNEATLNGAPGALNAAFRLR